jgi:putative DNA primase/helicase
MLELPYPIHGKSLMELLPLVLNATGDNLKAAIAWDVHALRGRGPFPVLQVRGEHGVAKTSSCKLLRNIVDPSIAEMSHIGKEVRNLMISARNSHIVGFDNVSYIPDEMSDVLCRISTGAGFRTRTNYTDLDETIFKTCRPIILNSIGDPINRPDLLDRTLSIELEPISDEQRRLDDDIEARFAEIRPALLGALADAVSRAIREPVTLRRLPRMANFAAAIESAAPALGWDPGEFMKIYDGQQQEMGDNLLGSDVIGSLLLKMIEQQLTFKPVAYQWEGTAEELITQLGGYLFGNPPKYFPQTPKALQQAFKRIMPLLRPRGVEISPPTKATTDPYRNQRVILIQWHKYAAAQGEPEQRQLKEAT